MNPQLWRFLVFAGAMALLILLLGFANSGSERMEEGLKWIGPHDVVVTKPTPIDIGLPSRPLPPEVLEQMGDICRRSGAMEVYWFWIAINGETPHLGLAVAPYEKQAVNRIGRGIEPIWRRHHPENPVFDLIPLDGSSKSQTIRKSGRLLFRRLTPSGGPP